MTKTLYRAWDNDKSSPLCDRCNDISEQAKKAVDMPVGFDTPKSILTEETRCVQCGEDLPRSNTLDRAKAGDWVEQARIYVAQCDYPSYALEVKTDSRGAVYLRAFYAERDTVTDIPEIQYTRRWFLSPEMSKSEIVATAFKCIMTSMEHRVREWFTYRQRAIYMPHYDVDKLHQICEDRQKREVSV